MSGYGMPAFADPSRADLHTTNGRQEFEGRSIEFQRKLIAAAWRDQSGEAPNQALETCAPAQ
jgi:hypothetical protein